MLAHTARQWPPDRSFLFAPCSCDVVLWPRLVFWISMVATQIIQASLAKSIQVQIATEYSDDFQRSCLKGTEFVSWETGEPNFYMKGTNSEACDAFLNDPWTMKLQTMWYNMYRLSLDEDKCTFIEYCDEHCARAPSTEEQVRDGGY